MTSAGVTGLDDWTQGYLAGLDYSYGYYGELNPVRVPLPFLIAGLASPEISTACELGFGQGISVNIHAAGSGHQWYGTDFNPAHAAFAQATAAASGAEAKLFDQSFAEFCNRTDLPDFEFIGLHGIWSWVSEENQNLIVDFVRRRLKVGGVLYIGYNTQPGWATMIPVQQLMTEYLELAPPARDPLARIDAAFNFVEKLCVTEPIYARANPTVAGHLKACKGFDRVYLAHEYLNRNWLPIPFAEMAKKLARAKLTYACSANLLDFVDAINLTAAQQAFLAEIPDPMFRQSVRDFIVDKQYRRDYWVKGLRRLSTVEQTEAIARQRLILTTGSADIAMRLSSTLGEISLIDPVYAPIIERLADHKPASIGEIAEVLTSRGVSMDRGYVALAILAGKGDLQPARDAAAVEKAKVQTDKFNLYMLAKARGSDQLSFLASPVTGGGIGVSRIQQLFLLARAEGWKTPKEWAEVVVRFFAAHGQTIEKDGRAFQTPEEQLADLCAEATQFAAKRVPILEALQIV